MKTKKKEKKNRISASIKFTILAIILIAMISVALTPVTLQNDTYYNIKVGEHIIKYGIDMKDPFSWHQDLGYTYPHWGYDAISYIIYIEFGMMGIYVTTCILAAILGITIYLMNTKLTKNHVLSFFITIGVMYLIRGYIAARVQLVTFILFALTILFIEKFLETKKIGYAIGLIIIPIIIANIHIAVFPFYFVLYLPYIAEYLIALIAEIILYKKIRIKILQNKINRLKKKQENSDKIEKLETKFDELKAQVNKIKIKRSKELQNPYKIKLTKNKNTKWLILIMVICLFTGLLSPLGTEPYTYLYKTMQGNTTQNINEHLPMTLSEETEVMCVLVLFLAPLIFTRVKIRLCDLFMIGGLFYLMISSRRQVSMFAIVGSVILNRIITNLLAEYKNEEIIENWKKKMTSIIGIVITSLIAIGLSYYFVKDKLDDRFTDPTTYPIQACNYILENVDLENARFYNEYNYGSYMIFRGIPVFIDSRADLYAPEFSGKEDDIFMDFIETSGVSRFYEDTFEKYDITHVITYKNSKVNMIIEKTKDKNYEQLYSDDYFVIYKRLNDVKAGS